MNLNEATFQLHVVLNFNIVRQPRAKMNPLEQVIIPKHPSANSELSYAQLQMWVLNQMSPGNPAYNLPAAYRLRGSLDSETLEKSFNEIIRRHEVLRTTFEIVDGEPRQIKHSSCKIRIDITRLDDISAPERERQVHILAEAEARAPFDLSRLPLIRLRLFKLSDRDHILLVNLHHIVGDGVSLGLMLDELNEHYRLLTKSNHGSSQELPIQYGDFSAWERETVGSKKHEREIAFWQQELNDAPQALDLPTDLQRPPVQSYKGSNVFFTLPQELINQIETIGASQGCSLFVTLLAAFVVLLRRYSHQDEIVLGTPVARRPTPETRSLIGNFINMIPLRLDLSGDLDFLQVLKRCGKQALRAFSKGELPFAKIIENVRFRRDPSRSPLFQAMVEILPGVTARIGDLQLERYYFDLGAAQFDLSFHAWKEDYGYACRFEYCTELFYRDTIQRMSANFIQLLASIARGPGLKIANIPILNELERSQLLVEWNRTNSEYPSKLCIHHLIEEVAKAKPDSVAVESDGTHLTYRELNLRANLLAHHLIRCGVQNEDLVGIYLERSANLVVGLLGILKAGASYVPLDPLFPADRLSYMIEDAGIRTVVTQSKLSDTLTWSHLRLVCVDSDITEQGAEGAQNPSVSLQSSSLAYTIYTSGSSGRPKGVMIEHRALVNCLCAMQREPGFNESDILVAVTTISFDIAALEVFLPLISGGKLVIASKDQAMDGWSLVELLARCRATMLQATPSTWKLLAETNWKPALNFKMLCGGEALTRDLADQLLQRGGQLFNMYGPTESTIWSSVLRIESTSGPVLIGPPIANTQFYVVDDHMEPVPIGVPGELMIGGDGLARGYLNKTELTAERFVLAKFAGCDARVYKTGDTARFRSDGCIEFLGRRDFQVKVRGYRIELEEIENVLGSHKSIQEAAVVPWEDPDGDTRLVAYYVPSSGQKPEIADLREHLREKLPEYMCPSFFEELPSFPLTPNRKIDRKAFPPPDLSGRDHDINPVSVALQSDLEAQLTGIWQEALKCPVSPDDNFFDLGGHSLLAARVSVMIEKRLRVRLPLATLFQNPTIRTLASKIEKNAHSSDWRALVPFNTRGSRPPLFLIHGAEGNVLLYKNLADHLGPDQPVYGLQSEGLDGKEVSARTIENIAARYIKEIRSAQQSGPYYVGGYCLGGTIALEIAQQLMRAGEIVALVALLETYNIKGSPAPSTALSLYHKVQNLYFQAGNLLLSGGSGRFFMEKLRLELSRLKIQCEVFGSTVLERLGFGKRANYLHLRVKSINHMAQNAYEPEPYNGTVALFRSRRNYAGFEDPLYGWGHIAIRCIHVVELFHYPHGSLNEPFVGTLADSLRRAMDRASDQVVSSRIAAAESVDRAGVEV